MAKRMRVRRQQVKWFQPKKFLAGGVINFFPDPPEGEDEHTWNTYQMQLKEQHNLQNQKKDQSPYEKNISTQNAAID